MEIPSSSLHTTDGLALHLRHWPCEGPQGRVLIVHGLGEHIERYAAVAGSLNSMGWAVSGYDQRGHGRSEGPRGGIAQDDSLCADLAGVIDAVRGPGRLVLLGHSLGGLLAARFVAEALAAAPAAWSRPVDALVLSSPALDLGMGAFQKLLLAVLGPMAPGLAVNNGLKPEWISRDPAVVRAYVQDPLVHDRVTPRLVRFLVDSGARVQLQASRWTVPTLLMWAGSDRCVAPRGSVSFAAAAAPAVVRAEAFALLFHEIFNEPERDQVLASLTGWLESLDDGR
jgi:alpha-beta hydrolase superfamily lysophospholipase